MSFRNKENSFPSAMTRVGGGNPEGAGASPPVGERPDQPPQGGDHQESEEYNLRRTPGGSVAEPLGV